MTTDVTGQQFAEVVVDTTVATVDLNQRDLAAVYGLTNDAIRDGANMCVAFQVTIGRQFTHCVVARAQVIKAIIAIGVGLGRSDHYVLIIA